MKHPYTAPRMSKIQNTNNTNVDEDVRQQELSHSLLIGMQMAQTLWKAVWQLFTKLTILLPYDSINTLFGISPNDFENLCLHNTCMNECLQLLYSKLLKFGSNQNKSVICMETQKIPNSQVSLDKEQIWKYPVYWFQLYYKATAIKRARY